jgi:branched-subunit amino acid transport protein
MTAALGALVVAAVGTYVLRFSSVHIGANRALPAEIDTALRYAALAILASLVIAGLPDNGESTPIADPATACGLIAGVVAARLVRNVAATIAISIAVYAVAGALGG